VQYVITQAGAGGQALTDLLEQWQQRNYYEILAVSENATREEVQNAYLQLARCYHPDRFSRESGSTRACATDLFTLLGSARDTLSDASARQEYTRKLRGASQDDERDKVQRILGAERHCQNGEGLLRKHNVAGALAEFAQAIELNPTEGEFHALFGWAYFLAHREEGEQASLSALESFQRAVELAPESPKGYYYLAQLHKACGRPDMARKLFAKVLQLDPNHVEAQREKRLLIMRKEKDPRPSSGGLFGFGRKKS
jgi:tetratricopeptide (TPR) repeat protein